MKKHPFPQLHGYVCFEFYFEISYLDPNKYIQRGNWRFSAYSRERTHVVVLDTFMKFVRPPDASKEAHVNMSRIHDSVNKTKTYSILVDLDTDIEEHNTRNGDFNTRPQQEIKEAYDFLHKKHCDGPCEFLKKEVNEIFNNEKFTKTEKKSKIKELKYFFDRKTVNAIYNELIVDSVLKA